MSLLNIYDSPNYANNLIKQSIKDLKYDNNQNRYRFIDKLLDYYQGDDTGNTYKIILKLQLLEKFH